MEVCGLQLEFDFFFDFPDGAVEGRFAGVHVELAAYGGVEALVGGLGAV